MGMYVWVWVDVAVDSKFWYLPDLSGNDIRYQISEMDQLNPGYTLHYPNRTQGWQRDKGP